MANNDIIQAFQALNQGLKEYNTANAINTASETLAQVRDETKDATQVRQAQQQIADQLQAHLAAVGSDPNQIKQALQGIGPKQFQSPSQAALFGALSNDKQLIEAAEKASIASQAGALELQNNAQLFKTKENELEFERKMMLAELQGTGKSIPTGQLQAIQEIESDLIAGEDILQQFQNDPELKQMIGFIKGRDPFNIRAKWSSPKYGAFKAKVGQWFDVYRKRITGAGAGVVEIDMLKENRPAVTDDPKIFIKKIQDSLATGQKFLKGKFQVLGKAGYNVSKFINKDGTTKINALGEQRTQKLLSKDIRLKKMYNFMISNPNDPRSEIIKKALEERGALLGK